MKPELVCEKTEEVERQDAGSYTGKVPVFKPPRWDPGPPNSASKLFYSLMQSARNPRIASSVPQSVAHRCN